MTKKDKSGISLSKYLAECGICARRKATEIIKQGMVSVNNFVITNPAHHFEEGQVVRVNKKVVKPEPKVYLALNKPWGYVTTVADQMNRKTVMDLIGGAPKHRIYPIGRLDYATSGLLLITNDGDMAQKLAHPSFNIEKTYHVKLNKSLEDKDLLALQRGIKLAEGVVKFDHIKFQHPLKRVDVVLTIHSGQNRVIRRVFESMGYDVDRLDRLAYAGISKKGLATGHWRLLTGPEVVKLLKLLEYKKKSQPK